MPKFTEQVRGHGAVDTVDRKRLFFALLLIGIPVLLVLLPRGRAAPPPTNLVVRTQQEIIVRGKLNGPQDGAKVIFHFPEATLDIEKPVSELNVQPDGSFTATLEVDVERPPRQVGLTARRPGYQDSKEVVVQLQDGQATLPPVTLEPVRRLVSERDKPPGKPQRMGRGSKEAFHQRSLERREAHKKHEAYRK